MRRRSSGFTLIETLIAIALFGLAAGAFMMVIGNLSRGLARDGATSEDDFIKEFALHLVLSKTSREAALRGGESTLPNGGKLRWSVEIEPATLADLHRLTIHYSVTGHPGIDHIIRTLAHKIEWSDPVARAVRINGRREELPPSRLDW